jgi:hypothetical protein
MITEADTRPNPFNADLARRTLAAIENDPAHWNQKAWISSSPECGTAYCFAGWAVKLHDAVDPGYTTPIEFKAVEALGLDQYLASPLFAPANSLADLRNMVADYAAAASMHELESVASGWGAGVDDDEDYEEEPDDGDWYDE